MKSLQFACRELLGSPTLGLPMSPQPQLCRFIFSSNWNSTKMHSERIATKKSTNNSPLICNNFKLAKYMSVSTPLFNPEYLKDKDKLRERLWWFMLRKRNYEDGVEHTKKKLEHLRKMVEEAEANNFSLLLDSEERDFPKILASFHIISKIETMARLLADDNVEHRAMFYTLHHVDKLENFRTERTLHRNVCPYTEYWKSIMMHSRKPLVFELKMQLVDAVIPEKIFWTSIAFVYNQLLVQHRYSYWEPVPYGPQDIIDVVNDLAVAIQQPGAPMIFESFRILFNLVESPEWKI